MLSLNNLHYNVLLAQMLRTPAIMAMALKHLKGEFFTLPEVGGTKVQALIFTVIADHVKEQSTAPDMAMLHVYIESAINGLLQDEEARAEYLNGLNAFEAFCPKVDDRSIKLCQEMIQQLADTCVFEPAAMELISSGAMSTPVDQLDDLICKLQEVSSQRRSTSASDVVNNVMSTKIEDGQRELSGVSWFDARCGEGRGPVMGTVMGLLAPQGGGKCLGKGTRVRLYSGQVVNVEDVIVGDQLMGPTSKPRTVLSINTGGGALYRISSEKFNSFVCNDVHVMTFWVSTAQTPIDVPLDEYLFNKQFYDALDVRLFRVSSTPKEYVWASETSKFTVEAIGEGSYYGFTLDGDGRFLLEDFTVTHNTTSGFEFCINKALLGKPSLLSLAEEGLTRNVLNKIAARTTGISSNEIAKIDVTDFNNILSLAKSKDMDLEMLKLKHDMVQKNLHILDLVENEGGMEEIESTIDSMAMADKKPHTIYIDWAGIMAERIMSVGLRGREFSEIFDALKALSFAAENLAERHNTFTVFSHQLASVAAAKGVGYNTTVYDAADCKTWTAPFMYVLTISGMHPKTLLQRARLVKSRYEPPGQEAVLKLHGAFSRFEDMSDKFELRGKNFVSKTPKDSKAMPKEK